MKKIKSIVGIILVMIVTITGLTACRHHCNKHCRRCCKEMCSKDSSCCKKEGCMKDGSCCMKDKKMSCCAKDEKKSCCAKGGDMHGTGMYRCPMDSDVTSDKPGKCPKCGMELRKMK